MTKINRPRIPITTHEGGRAKHINAEQQLRRSLMACLLWEDQFYEDGISIADRIASLVPEVAPEKVLSIAGEARKAMKLRHAPLLVVREMARHPKHKNLVAEALAEIIQRADELTEFLAIYWQDGKQPLSAQVKRGLAEAFLKFDAYQLAKYNRDTAIKLRDILFLCHAKPQDKEQAAVWKKLIDGTLESPDTWEVALSAGADKKETFERLMAEGKLGALALLRNLRNMAQADVDRDLIFSSLDGMNVARVLPFRFISAARHAPQWEPQIEKALMKCLASQEKIGGKTILLSDVSSSMDSPLSAKSELSRIDAACGLGILARELCDEVDILTFSGQVVLIPPRHGFALRDAVVGSQPHDGTYLGNAVHSINSHYNYDRIIVITDEQAHDDVPDPKAKGYLINVASYQNGVGYGKWTHIDGFSEATLNYIMAAEKPHGTIE